ncbi:hypothetical protein CC80DRAFT_475126 [Byssothecium circinans]|uniref:Clr5 domain-containing protein n=1 Tax=Byssothecium circinans TaxID=147558 RepID=A0A6A5TQR9_9PLEO|nr:hypothetical protein CC80DRAFT_475126 [Byssothecium circinans]
MTSTDRWETLKPVIEQLYLYEKRKVSDVVVLMRNDHGFDAGENQYKYHFKKWKWKRNIPSQKKASIATQLESRAQAGKMTGAITFQGRPVEMHKIRRHLKNSVRTKVENMTLDNSIATGPVFTFANGIFLKWNLPYAALRHVQIRPFDHTSPLFFSAPTPGSDIVVVTPPTSADTLQDAPSPKTTTLVNRKMAIDRAHLFAQGQHDTLLQSMNKKDRVVMADWLYQYWFFSFKTAKNWGKGPRAWTAGDLQFERFSDTSRRSLPGTPGDSAQPAGQSRRPMSTPTDLCRWLIHVPGTGGDIQWIDEAPLDHAPAAQDPQDESTWIPWSANQMEPPLHTRLRDALEHNDFSPMNTEELPIALPHIAKAAERSPKELLLESLGFSIISRNVAQVEDTLSKMKEEGVDRSSIYPLHLAATYLDGDQACCEVVRIILREFNARDIYINDYGHTVLDNLMITILKSHTSVDPAMVSSSWKDTVRFPGEEMDICGRWDADSPCVRQNLASGNTSLPFSWKHKFCHTSIHAIWHCVILLHDHMTRAVVEGESGLFGRHCFHCGTKLQLTPLHTLVITAYYLATQGCEEEDLFGMLAILLCFITCGFDVQRAANVSISALFQDLDWESICDHSEMTPAELAETITQTNFSQSMNSKAQRGWSVFCGILRLCQNNSILDEDLMRDGTDEEEDDEDFTAVDPPDVDHQDLNYGDHIERKNTNLLRRRKDVGTLWAAVQAEILTYRRLEKGDSWTSNYFSMEDLHSQLSLGVPLHTGFSEEGLLQTHCVCGGFNSYPFPTLLDATTEYVANLDVWQRATYAAFDLSDY